MTAPEEREFTTTLELRDAQAVGRPFKYLEGRAVPYGTWADIGWFLEQHRHGSFKRSTNGSRSDPKIPLLLFHDNRSFPIGHAESWTHPDDGLHGVWKLNDSAEAQRAAGMADDGDLVGLSIGFQDVTRPEWEWPKDFDPDGGPEAKARVTRIESRLLEVSMTPTPAFADATVSMVRTRARPPAPPEREVDRWRRIVEALHSA
jgi:HK97 family phage prohead protease